MGGNLSTETVELNGHALGGVIEDSDSGDEVEPLATRQRLVWIFSQMLASQLAVQRPQEDSYDSND